VGVCPENYTASADCEETGRGPSRRMSAYCTVDREQAIRAIRTGRHTCYHAYTSRPINQVVFLGPYSSKLMETLS
jgi:hypothetical protein